MKIALAQINPTIGAFKKNVEKIRLFIEQAKDKNADMVVFPEMSVAGYPPRDLLERHGFVTDNLKALDDVIGFSQDIAVIVGFVDVNPDKNGKPLFNAAAFLYDGKVVSKHYKSLLPSYDVFDEHRYFEPARTVSTVEHQGIRFGITICEDIWALDDVWKRPLYRINPVEDLVNHGAEFIVNISASPFDMGKIDKRCSLITSLSKKYKIPFVYVNQVGGNDDLVFDGNSVAVDSTGMIAANAVNFDEDLLLVDISNKQCTTIDNCAIRTSPSNTIENVYNALVLGLRDYVKKCGFKKAVLGLSGGIDSAVVAAIATKALGGDNVVGVAMPSKYSSNESIEDARSLSNNLGINLKEIPINEIHDSYTRTLEGSFEGLSPDTTEENLQARIRGNIVMALSNKFGYLVLTTGNKSELSVGYCTLYGDMCGGLAVISDVPKMMVYKLAEYINLEKELIPLNTIKKAPSAELRPDQKDQDSLPPYPVLDEILKAYIEETKNMDEIIKMGYDKDLVQEIIKKIDRNEYKRKQAAPGLRVTSKAFGAGRRIPIAQSYEENDK